MTQFIAVSNRKGGVGKSTISVMLAHAAASFGKRQVLLMDLDTQCNASLMLVGGEGWEKASRTGHTIADYFYDRFEKVAEDESAYVMKNIGDVNHGRFFGGRVSLLPGSQRLEDIQTELFVMQSSKRETHADAVAIQVRGRMKRLMKHFGMDFDLVIMDCPPGLSFAALARLLVVVEGKHDGNFLGRISAMLHRHDPTIPDLGAWEAQGLVLRFCPWAAAGWRTGPSASAAHPAPTPTTCWRADHTP